MYDELVKKLRYCGNAVSCLHCPYWAGCGGSKEDLIQAADAIEELQQIAGHYEESAHDYFKDVCYYLERMPKWIPVTERLPNCNGCYLVWRPHFFSGEIGMPSICYFDGSNTWHDSYGVDFARILRPEDVTHWMPLPEAPKDGE